jgi:hypothetical protein
LTKHNFDSIISAFALISTCGSLFNLVICTAQQLERDLSGAATESISADKKLAIFDKLFSAYHDARGCIRNDLV